MSNVKYCNTLYEEWNNIFLPEMFRFCSNCRLEGGEGRKNMMRNNGS